MHRSKYKQFIKYLFVGLAFFASLAVFNITGPNKTVHAAYVCDPNKAACCQAPQLVANNGAAGPCVDSSGNKLYPVVDNADNSPQPEKGHCYMVKSSAFGFVYYNVDCSVPPFNVNWQSVTCGDGSVQTGAQKFGTTTITADMLCKGHGGIEKISVTTPVPTVDAIGFKEDCQAASLNKGNCHIIGWLVIFINTLSALVGIVVIIVLIVAGIQWSSAGNNPQQLAAAKSRIVNALLALLVFIFMYAFLQWIVPGGVF